jgi:uncharacterized membrane protein
MQIPTILYRLAIACWVGGATLFTFVLTPTIFKSFNRDMAGGIVGALFPGYFKWGLVCGVVALATVFLSSPVKHKTIAAVIIAVMIAITSAQAFVIEPKAAALKKEIPSFETTPKDDPLRIKFGKLHSVSAVSNLVVIVGGIALVVLL